MKPCRLYHLILHSLPSPSSLPDTTGAALYVHIFQLYLTLTIQQHDYLTIHYVPMPSPLNVCVILFPLSVSCVIKLIQYFIPDCISLITLQHGPQILIYFVYLLFISRKTQYHEYWWELYHCDFSRFTAHHETHVIGFSMNLYFLQLLRFIIKQ